MTTNLYLLNLGLLGFVLWANLGTRTVTARRLLLPLALVTAAAAVFLREVPTTGNDVALEAAGTLAGLVLGVMAGALVRVRRDRSGALAMHAGAAYAALWVVVIGGRVMFAYGADHWFPAAIGRFSMTNQITGADAWAAAFILLSLAMVTARVATSAVVIYVARRREMSPSSAAGLARA